MILGCMCMCLFCVWNQFDALLPMLQWYHIFFVFVSSETGEKGKILESRREVIKKNKR